MRIRSATRGAVVALLVGLAAAATAATLYLGASGHTPPLTDADGNEIAGSIAVLERVELGGLEQWILIRGQDRSNPVLLWVHGGPGGAQMPFAHQLDRRLEEHFVVVHWDQRGAGKSNHRGFDPATMQVERYVEDARELVEYLRRRLGQDRIVLLGHSWGTRIGLPLVQRHPEYFRAYVGVGQVVNHERATELARDWLLGVMDPTDAAGDLRALETLQIPARRHADFRELNRLTTAYGGSLDLPMSRFARIVLRAPEYTLADHVRLLRGFTRGGGPMHRGGIMENYDFITSIPAVDVPVYFFAGADDYNTPLALVREYMEVLDAPRKELVVFERSAHQPFLGEPGRFTDELIRVVGG